MLGNGADQTRCCLQEARSIMVKTCERHVVSTEQLANNAAEASNPDPGRRRLSEEWVKQSQNTSWSTGSPRLNLNVDDLAK